MEKMCGEDHNIYMSKCSMFGRGVALAYYGPCKEECLKFDVKVRLSSLCVTCVSDGVKSRNKTKQISQSPAEEIV